MGQVDSDIKLAMRITFGLLLVIIGCGVSSGIITVHYDNACQNLGIKQGVATTRKYNTPWSKGVCYARIANTDVIVPWND